MKRSSESEVIKDLDIPQVFQDIHKNQKVPFYKKSLFYDDSPIGELIHNLSFQTADDQIHYRAIRYIGDENIVFSIRDINGVIGSILIKAYLGYIYRKDFCWIYDAAHRQIAETKSHYIYTSKFTHEIVDVDGKKIGEIKPKWFSFPLKYIVDIYDTAIDPVFFIVTTIVLMELDKKFRYDR